LATGRSPFEIASAQSISPAAAGIIGGRRVWRALMTSALSIPLQVGRGDAEVRMAELALDHVQRHALAGQLDGVGVSELVRREAPADAGLGGEAA
jgi:hypothetical protein